MQRYFVNELNIETNKALIEEQDFHHLKHVMRHRIGDEVIVCKDSKCFLSSILEYQETCAVVVLKKELPSQQKAVTIDIAQGLIRRERFEYMLQKSTELGVDTIFPTMMARSIVKFDQKKAASKLARWNTIVKEASEQAHRVSASFVGDIHTLASLPFDEYDQILVCYEAENNSTKLKQVLQNKVEKILVVIGPEGGLTEHEIEKLSNIKNTFMVGLGPRILRSETASSYILSVLSYKYEMSD